MTAAVAHALQVFEETLSKRSSLFFTWMNTSYIKEPHVVLRKHEMDKVRTALTFGWKDVASRCLGEQPLIITSSTEGFLFWSSGIFFCDSGKYATAREQQFSPFRRTSVATCNLGKRLLYRKPTLLAARYLSHLPISYFGNA